MVRGFKKLKIGRVRMIDFCYSDVQSNNFARCKFYLSFCYLLLLLNVYFIGNFKIAHDSLN